ncbi:MAG: bacteriorhodopsin-like [Bdellovibrionota bacterium]|nr:bacteriorhodopsin-like [Bdellovibrionota bacterium]|tara:strand:+ start:18040 stop:18738 length:699 start_codon:yes stop_codon:yes gene_type:complete
MKELLLKSGDHVAISFWVISMAMVAATAFFFLERDRVSEKWKTSLTIAGLITGIAAWHYFYMREAWMLTGGQSPTEIRYVDWFITVPLQIVEFYVILAAVTTVASGLFWRLLVSSTVMLVAGYLGETQAMNVTLAFVIGMAGWLYIIYEIFAGEASKVNAASGNASSQKAFNTLRLIVTIGWAIYPIGYAIGYLGSGADAGTMNLVYNLADFVNKIAFGMAIYAAAVTDSKN